MAQRNPESDLAAEPAGHPLPARSKDLGMPGLKTVSAVSTPKEALDQGDSKAPPPSLWLPVRRTRTLRDPPATVRQRTFDTTRLARQ